jgi:uncharacterized protein (DUF1684 family)
MSTPANPISLAQWRRRVAELYADVRRDSADPERASDRFRAARDELFRQHPDSPIPYVHRARWRGASWFPYDPAWRIKGIVRPLEHRTTFEVVLAADGVTRCTRVAWVAFTARAAARVLWLYWFEGYGGGLWLPFGDATNGTLTYGGGRYLYDTIKGADLGSSAREFVLDFNFAYNPSCTYDERWSCPLSPVENKLAFDVPAGERVVDLEDLTG